MVLKMLLISTVSVLVLIDPIAAQSLPGCLEKCGNVTIPFPFGSEKGCYLSTLYKVNCDELQIWNTSFKLINISLDGHLRGSLPMGNRCYNKRHAKTSVLEPHIYLSRFPVSNTHNHLTVVGCDARANMKAVDSEDYITGCLSMTGCNGLTNGSCQGMGCSQVSVPYKLTSFRIHTQSNTKGTLGKWGFNKCTYSFLVEQGHYSFRSTDLDNMKNRSFPVVFEWSVGNTSCAEAKKHGGDYFCKENSVCNDSFAVFNQSHEGYRCHCAPGYEGNPYLPNGCQDINECEDPQNGCVHNCANTNGSYNCLCPFGQHGDGKINGSGCSYSRLSVFASIATGIATFVGLALIVYVGLKQRRTVQKREKFFKKNGGLILQKLLFESKQFSQMSKIFAAGVIEKATDNFHKSNVIGQGGYGIVYRGTLPDKKIVAIKKSKSIDENQIEQFVNEMISLSEISHPNVVKLLGCCLETQTPLLVYEFITNKTVFQHLHQHNDFISSLSLEKRLSIATDTVEALAYIHSTTQIVHRDIKSSNILLTDDFTAKVSDFGISRFIPADQTHLQTLVHGTLGYIDPEYFRSGILTDKSDVYSFGMVLVELLTGRKVFSHDGTESELGLATFFLSSLETGCLSRILDDKVKKDGFEERIKKLADLAQQCVNLEGKKRPNMKRVKEELKMINQSYLKGSFDSEKVKCFDHDHLILFD